MSLDDMIYTVKNMFANVFSKKNNKLTQKSIQI